MTINDLMALNDDELLAALQAALERAEAAERDAAARVAKLARAIAAFDDAPPESVNVAKVSAHVGMPTLPPAATPKEARPKRARRDQPVDCPNCGKTFKAPAGLGSHLRFCSGEVDVPSGLGPIGHLPVDEDKARDAAAGPRTTVPASGQPYFTPPKKPEPKPEPPAKPDRFSVEDARAHIDSLASVR